MAVSDRQLGSKLGSADGRLRRTVPPRKAVGQTLGGSHLVELRVRLGQPEERVQVPYTPL